MLAVEKVADKRAAVAPCTTAVSTLARDFAHHRIQRVDNTRNSARLLGRWSGALKPADNRGPVAVTEPPFPPGRASLSNQHFQHGRVLPSPVAYRQDTEDFKMCRFSCRPSDVV